MRVIPLGAELALVDGTAVPWCDADNLLVLDNKVKAATTTAVRACCWYVFHVHVLTSNDNDLYLTLFKHTEIF